MTSVLGAFWTALQGVGWLLYFIRQLVSDTLNINYRVVSAAGHLIAGVAKIAYTLLGAVCLAVYEVVWYVLSSIVSFLTCVFDCTSFVLHCCTLLCQVVYYTVTVLADGLFFVVLTPICACQTIHSWVTWIFNTEHWIKATVWCFETCKNAATVVANKTWEYLFVAVGELMYAGATFAYDSVVSLSYSIHNNLLALSSFVIETVSFLLLQTWSFSTLPFYFVYTYLVAIPVYLERLWELCTFNNTCLILVLLATLLLVFLGASLTTRLIVRFVWHSRDEVIRIDFDDMADVIEISDDERDNFHDRTDLLEIDDDDEETEEDSEAESSIIDTSEEVSVDSDIGSDTDTDDNDAETIDVQLPDQPSSSSSSTLVNGRTHGYATRSKGSADTNRHQPQVEVNEERSLCVVCRDQVKSVLVLPCRHMCMCVDCARTVVSGSHGQRRMCPLCRGNIRIVMNVYT